MAFNKLTHPGNILLTGFGAMLIMMSLLVYLSVKQDIPMVSKNYYEQELQYQQRLDAMNNTNVYDSEFNAHWEGNYLLLQLPLALAASMEHGVLYFYCPADETMDYQEHLPARTDGRYTFDRSLFQGKRYIAKISFTCAGKNYYKEIALD